MTDTPTRGNPEFVRAAAMRPFTRPAGAAAPGGPLRPSAVRRPTVAPFAIPVPRAPESAAASAAPIPAPGGRPGSGESSSPAAGWTSASSSEAPSALDTSALAVDSDSLGGATAPWPKPFFAPPPQAAAPHSDALQPDREAMKLPRAAEEPVERDRQADPREHAAAALEAVARRVRSGEIVVSSGASASEGVVLASVLAALLEDR